MATRKGISVSDWQRIVRDRIGPVHAPRADKRMALGDAIRRFVRPGMCLNPMSLPARPVAALHELIRQFHGRNPRFTFVSSSLSGNDLQRLLAGAQGVPFTTTPSLQGSDMAAELEARRAYREIDDPFELVLTSAF